MLGSPRSGADDGGLEGVFPLGSFRRKPIPLSAWVRSPAANAAVIGRGIRGVSTDVSDVSKDPVEVANSVWPSMLGVLAYVVDASVLSGLRVQPWHYARRKGTVPVRCLCEPRQWIDMVSQLTQPESAGGSGMDRSLIMRSTN